MTGGADLASAPLARAVLARWSWRPAGVQGMQHLLGRLAAHRSPMLERARGLQAWHDGLAHRWRTLDMVQPARMVGEGGPVSPGGMAAPAGPHDGAATALGIIPAGSGFGAGGGGPRPSGAGADHPRFRYGAAGAAAGGGTRSRSPGADDRGLGGARGDLRGPLPVPSRPSTPAVSAAPDATSGPALVPAIGRRFARREMAGGFPEAPSRGPGGRETPAARPMPPLVRWRASRPSDDAYARRRASDGNADLPTAPALPALWAGPALPAHRTDRAPDRRTRERRPRRAARRIGSDPASGAVGAAGAARGGGADACAG